MAVVVGMGMVMALGCDEMYAFPRISRRQRGLSFVPGHGAFPAGHCRGGFFLGAALAAASKRLSEWSGVEWSRVE